MNGREEMVALINEEYKGAYRRFKPEKCCIGRCQGVSAWLLLQDHGFSLDSGTPGPNTKLPGTTYSFPHSSNPKYPFISYYLSISLSITSFSPRFVFESGRVRYDRRVRPIARDFDGHCALQGFLWTRSISVSTLPFPSLPQLFKALFCFLCIIYI